MTQVVEVSTGSRLHFGLIGWGPQHERQFGGVGVMVAPPSLIVRASPDAHFSAHGPLADRAIAIVQRLATHWQLDTLPACRLEVVAAPPAHAGLGTGTALSLAIVSAVTEMLYRDQLTLEEMALITGRGLRSAVGARGFAGGGLIYEDGKAAGDVLGRLKARVALPGEWRFVLIRTAGAPGLGGDDERRAFELVSSTPLRTANELRRIAEAQIISAARVGDFEGFSAAVGDYNRLAGNLFANIQGSNYANAEISELITVLLQRGIHGAGQSSWGPTVFAVVPHEAAALELNDWLKRERGYEKGRITIASPVACREATHG
jgi:beta-ribofuranosylaminobenzene 5'-phosphate synthase